MIGLHSGYGRSCGGYDRVFAADMVGLAGVMIGLTQWIWLVCAGVMIGLRMDMVGRLAGVYGRSYTVDMVGLVEFMIGLRSGYGRSCTEL